MGKRGKTAIPLAPEALARQWFRHSSMANPTLCRSLNFLSGNSFEALSDIDLDETLHRSPGAVLHAREGHRGGRASRPDFGTTGTATSRRAARAVWNVKNAGFPPRISAMAPWRTVSTKPCPATTGGDWLRTSQKVSYRKSASAGTSQRHGSMKSVRNEGRGVTLSDLNSMPTC